RTCRTTAEDASASYRSSVCSPGIPKTVVTPARSSSATTARATVAVPRSPAGDCRRGAPSSGATWGALATVVTASRGSTRRGPRSTGCRARGGNHAIDRVVGLDRRDERADAVDPPLHDVARLEVGPRRVPDAAQRPRREDVPRFEGHEPRGEGDGFGDREDHVRGRAVLVDGPIDREPQAHVLREIGRAHV